MRRPSIGSPSRTLALLAGAVFGFTMPLVHAWQQAPGVAPETGRLALAAALVVLFVAPVLWFVVGAAHLSLGRGAAFRASLAQVGVRALCWLAGAAAGFGALAAIRPGS